MAKFAKVGYGSQGQGLGKTENGYTYIVNDNVRTHDVIQVISTSHGKTPKKFATTGKVNHSYKENSVKGQEAKQEAQENGASEITRSYTGKELGAKGSKSKQVISKYADGYKHKSISEYEKSTRAGNLAKYMQSHPNAQLTAKSQQTFDSYSKQFMNKGEQ